MNTESETASEWTDEMEKELQNLVSEFERVISFHASVRHLPVYDYDAGNKHINKARQTLVDYIHRFHDNYVNPSP